MVIMKHLMQLKLIFMYIFMLIFGHDNDGTSELHALENDADEDLSTSSDGEKVEVMISLKRS